MRKLVIPIVMLIVGLAVVIFVWPELSRQSSAYTNVAGSSGVALIVAGFLDFCRKAFPNL
ncbi:MAG: hypothetical protein K8T91_04125 [Planctomycetes bacterium]|nr:hypothetical protein [Planctomycetota bacterium]